MIIEKDGMKRAIPSSVPQKVPAMESSLDVRKSKSTTDKKCVNPPTFRPKCRYRKRRPGKLSVLRLNHSKLNCMPTKIRPLLM